jgi:hypothetical protein
VDNPVNVPREVAALLYGDSTRPYAYVEAKCRRTVGVIAGGITARHAQQRPSADGRVKSFDELAPEDLLCLALDGFRATLRNTLSIVDNISSEGDLDYSLKTMNFLSCFSRQTNINYRRLVD